MDYTPIPLISQSQNECVFKTGRMPNRDGGLLPLCFAAVARLGNSFPTSCFLAAGPLFFHNVLKSETHHHPESETRALKARLRKIVGQLNGVERMLEADRDCAEVLTQLVSARKAIKSLSEKIINTHLHHCIEHATDPASGKKRLAELLIVLERYIE